MAMKFANNAVSTLSADLSSTATSLTVQAGDGSKFPALLAGDYFYVTLANILNALEIVKVTARSGDTMTIVRGQDGTTARGYALGDKVELRLVAAAMREGVDHAARTDNPHAVTASQVGAYTKSEVDGMIGGTVPSGDFATALAGKANVSHSHPISEVTGLQTALDGKSATGHTHSPEQITGLSDSYYHNVYNADHYEGTNNGLGFRFTTAYMTADGGALTLHRVYEYI